MPCRRSRQPRCLQKLDETQVGSIDIAIAKARTAARMKRPTKALEDAVAGGRTVMLAVDGLMPLEGGVPVTVGGRIIGAVGVSGVTSQQDAQVAARRAAVGKWRAPARFEKQRRPPAHLRDLEAMREADLRGHAAHQRRERAVPLAPVVGVDEEDVAARPHDPARRELSPIWPLTSSLTLLVSEANGLRSQLVLRR